MAVLLVVMAAAAQEPATPVEHALIPSDAALEPEAAESIWTERRWNPYAVGAAIGVLAWLSFYLSNEAIGVSTAYVRTLGMAVKSTAGPKAVERPYFQKFAPKIDWEWLMVAGLLIGALVSALTSGDFRWEWVPPLWAADAGTGALARLLTAFVGGALLAIGARWAGGCTSGHGISGTLQLAVSSWVAVLCFFVGGVTTALLLYGAFFQGDV